MYPSQRFELALETSERDMLGKIGGNPGIFNFQVQSVAPLMVYSEVTASKLRMAQLENISFQDNDRGESAVSYKWTWEITGWSLRLQEIYRSF